MCKSIECVCVCVGAGLGMQSDTLYWCVPYYVWREDECYTQNTIILYTFCTLLTASTFVDLEV